MKRPSMTFYPDDWLTDLALRQCSPAARGIWMDILCLMHQGDPYGHLSSPVGPLTDRLVANACGISAKELRNLMAELETHDVFSRDPKGVPFSRRMVKDEQTRTARAAGGPKSTSHPDVPKRKDTLKVPIKDPLKDTFMSSQVRDHEGPPHVEGMVGFKTPTSEDNSRNGKYDAVSGFRWFAETYPAHRFDEFVVAGVYFEIVENKEIEDKIRQHLPVAMASEEWSKDGGKFVPSASRYIAERRFDMPNRSPETGRKIRPMM